MSNYTKTVMVDEETHKKLLAVKKNEGINIGWYLNKIVNCDWETKDYKENTDAD